MPVWPPELPQRLAFYLAMRWAIFPVKGKVPLTAGGFKDASPDPTRWLEWLRDYPECGWAAPTGSVNGFDVVDADTDRAVRDLQARIPPGPRVRTGGGGMHFYIKHHPGARNWAKRIPGVDFRGDGGYVVIPESPHGSGRRYAWVEGTESLVLPETPSWLVDVHMGTPPRHTSGAVYLEGERNDRLFRFACAVRAKGGDVLRETLRANSERCSPTLTDAEVRTIVASAERYTPSDPVSSPATGRPLFAIVSHPVSGKPDEKLPDRAAFVEAMQTAHHFVAIEDTEELLVFEGGYYRPNARQVINRHVEELFRAEGLSSGSTLRREIVDAVRTRSYVPREEFNPPGLLAVRNGLLDLTDPANPKFGPHDPSTRLTFGLPVDYLPDSKCEGFLSFLGEIQPDAAVRDLLQEEAGYVLRLGNPYKIAFFWVGRSDSGKSTLQSILRGVCGRKNVSAISLQSLSDNRFASSMLFDKMANLFADLPSKTVRDTTVFKMLTGGMDEVSAEKKFQPGFTFVNPAKLFFAANEMPPVPGADEAYFRRWALTVFPVQIPIESQDPDLGPRLVRDEGPGILNWMIQGLARLQARGRYDLPASVVETGRLWRRLSDSLAWFAEAEIIRSEAELMLKTDLYAAYTGWCDDHGLEPKTVRQVGTELPRLVHGLKEAFPKAGGRGGTTARAWAGIRLRGEADPLAEVTLDAHPAGPANFERSVEPAEASTVFPGSTLLSNSDGPAKTRVAGRAVSRWDDEWGQEGGTL